MYSGRLCLRCWRRSRPSTPAVRLRHHVRHQAPHRPACPRAPPPPPAPPPVRRQHRLDLPQLDAEPAHLHLLVQPPQELELPVGTVARPGRRCDTSAPPPRPRTGPAMNFSAVSSGRPGTRAQPLSADAQLPRHPDRHRLQRPVQDVDLGVGNRTTDGRDLLAGTASPAAPTTRSWSRSDRTGSTAAPVALEQRPAAPTPPAAPRRPTSAVQPRRPRQPASISSRHVAGVACISVAPLASRYPASRLPSAATSRLASTTRAP